MTDPANTPALPLPFEEWTARKGTKSITPDDLRDYSDYAKTELLRSGQYDDTLAMEIDQSLADLAVEKGIEGDPNEYLRARRPEADLDLVQRHALELGETDVNDAVRAYRVLQDPDIAGMYMNPQDYEDKLQEARTMAESYIDPERVKAARLAALDRGDLPFVAIDQPDGQPPLLKFSPVAAGLQSDADIAAAFDANPDLDRRYIGEVRRKLAPVPGYTAPEWKIDRQQDFMAAADDLRSDPRFERLVKVMADGDTAASTAVIDDLATDPRFASFTPTERRDFLTDIAKRRGNPQVDPANPAAALRTLSTGEVHVPDAVMFNKGYFDEAIKAIPAEQQPAARAHRDIHMESRAPEVFKTLSEFSDDFVDFYDEAKKAGKSNGAILDEWMSDEDNYNAVGTRVTGTLRGVRQAFTDIPVSIAALAGSETALNVLKEQQRKMSARQQYVSLFGGKLGFGYDLANLVAPVAVDLTAAALTGGAAMAAVSAKSTIKSGIKARLRNALSDSTKTALGTFTRRAAARQATREGVDVTTTPLSTSAVLSMAGRDIARTIGTTATQATVLGTAFTRSAGSTYASLHATLSEEKNADGSPKYTPEQVNEIALGHGLIGGLITASVVGAFQFAGAAGVERILQQGLTRGQANQLLGRLRMRPDVAAAHGIRAESVDAMLGSIVAKATSNFLRAGVEEGAEESLDQFANSINMALATGEKWDITAAVKEAAYAGLLGFGMGAGVGAIQTARAKPLSEQRLENERRSTLLTLARRLDGTMPNTAAALRTAAAQTAPPAEADVPPTDATGGDESAPGDAGVAPVEPVTGPLGLENADMEVMPPTSPAGLPAPTPSPTVEVEAEVMDPETLDLMAEADELFALPAPAPRRVGGATPTGQPTTTDVGRRLGAAPVVVDGAAPDAPQTPLPTTDAPQTPATIDNVDELVANGGGVVSVSVDGRKVDFDQFALTITDGIAEVAMIRAKPSERGKGIGVKAYEALGAALAQRGVTLQSSGAQYGPGRDIWMKLAAEGKATPVGQGKFQFTQTPVTTPTTVEQLRTSEDSLTDSFSKSEKAKVIENYQRLHRDLPVEEELHEYRVAGFVTRNRTTGRMTLHVTSGQESKGKGYIAAASDVTDQFTQTPSPTQGTPTESLPTDQPTSGDGGVEVQPELPGTEQPRKRSLSSTRAAILRRMDEIDAILEDAPTKYADWVNDSDRRLDAEYSRLFSLLGRIEAKMLRDNVEGAAAIRTKYASSVPGQTVRADAPPEVAAEMEADAPASVELNDWVFQNSPQEYEASRYLDPTAQRKFHLAVWTSAGRPEIESEAAIESQPSSEPSDLGAGAATTPQGAIESPTAPAVEPPTITDLDPPAPDDVIVENVAAAPAPELAIESPKIRKAVKRKLKAKGIKTEGMTDADLAAQVIDGAADAPTPTTPQPGDRVMFTAPYPDAATPTQGTIKEIKPDGSIVVQRGNRNFPNATIDQKIAGIVLDTEARVGSTVAFTSSVEGLLMPMQGTIQGINPDGSIVVSAGGKNVTFRMGDSPPPDDGGKQPSFDPIGYGNALIDLFPSLKKQGVKIISIQETLERLDSEWASKVASGKATRLDQLVYLANKKNTESAASDSGSVGGVWTRSDKTIAAGPRATPSVIAHELGHAIMELEYVNASEEVKQAIQTEYTKWFRAKYGPEGTPTVSDQRRIWEWMTESDWMDPAAPFPPDQRVQKWENYRSSFSEWFADEVAKWASTSEKPKNLVGRFFSDLAAKMAKLWGAIKGNFSPNKPMAEWLESLTQENPPDDGGKQQPAAASIPTNAVTRELDNYGVREGTAAFLQNLFKSGPEKYRKLARLLASFDLPNIDLVHIPTASYAGMFNPRTGQVAVNTAKAGPRGAIDTALHELVHAALEQSLRNPTPEQAAVLKRLDRIRNTVAKRAAATGDSEIQYGLGSIDEFFTHFLTSPEFQRRVGAMTPKGQRNWIDVILDTLRALIGAKVKTATDKQIEAVWDEMIRFTQSAAMEKYGPHAMTTDGRVLLLPAYHGTPHKVDKFTLSKIGTGEGAQAFGWGLYFAEDKSVATHYAITVGGKPSDALLEEMASSGLQDFSVIAKKLRRENKSPGLIEEAERLGQRRKGNIYTVELLVDDDQLLDWDKPLSEQSENVRRAFESVTAAELSETDVLLSGLQDLGWTKESGVAAYKGLARQLGSPEKASKALAAAGIKGIRFLDGASRNRPFKDIKKDFLDALPEDAEFADVRDAIDEGVFKPEQVAFLNALEADDWFGFDYPAQAISAALSDRISNWDPSPELLASIEPLRGNATYNYVIFNENDIQITEENGQPVTATQATAPDPGPYGTARMDQLLMQPADLRNLSRFKELTADLEKVAVIRSFPKGVTPSKPLEGDWVSLDTPEGRAYQESYGGPDWDKNSIKAYVSKRDFDDMQTGWASGQTLVLKKDSSESQALTQADIDAWTQANPDKFAELERMRETVLRDAGFTARYNHGTSNTEFTAFRLPDPSTTGYARLGPGIYGAAPSDTQTTSVYGGSGRVIPLMVNMDNVVPEGSLTDSQINAMLGVLNPNLVLRDGNPVSVFMRGAENNDSLNAMWGLFQLTEPQKWYDAVRAAGIEGVTASFKGDETGEIAVYRSDKVKSTNPLNLDADGRLITPDRWADTDSPDIRFQPAAGDADLFYSALQRAVQAKIPARATPEQIMATVKAAGVKAEEIKWSGIKQALPSLAVDGKVSKDALLKYLADEGSVRFEEVALEDNAASRSDRWEVRPKGEGFAVWDEFTGEWESNITSEEAALTQIYGLQRSDRGRQNNTKYSQYVLPGGENYREVVLAMPSERFAPTKKGLTDQEAAEMQYLATLGDNYTMEQEARYAELAEKSESFTPPKISNDYTSSHFPDVPNYVAHMRTNERDGGLFIEEIQSDRHQAGRKRGYAGDNQIKTDEELSNLSLMVQPNESGQGFVVLDEFGNEFGSGDTRDAAVDNYNLTADTKVKNAVADAPFRTTWPLAMFKRALRDAVASGKEWIGWTTGATQSDRFDLSKQIDSLEWTWDNGEWELQIESPRGPISRFIDSQQELADTIGKDLADRIAKETSEGIKSNTYKGLDLKTESAGMKGFYDNMLPKEIGKYVKQWGGKVEKSSLSYDMDYKEWRDSKKLPATRETLDQFEAEKESGLKSPIWRVDITPEMRASVSTEGQALFQPATQPTSETPATPDAIRDAAIGYLPEGFDITDLDIDFTQLAEDVDGLNPLNAEDLIRSAVNYEVARVAAERELGDDYDPMLAESYYKAMTGNLPDRDRAFYIGNPNALERLVRYLATALRRLTDALTARFDRHTATAVNRINRALVAARDNFDVQPDRPAFDMDAIQARMQAVSPDEASDDLRFLPAAGDAPPGPNTNRVEDVLYVWDGDRMTQGNADVPLPETPWKRWLTRMFANESDLRRPQQKLFKSRNFIKNALDQQIANVSGNLKKLLKKLPEHTDLVNRSLGSNKPTLTKEAAERINRETAETLATLWAEESEATRVAIAATDAQLKAARSAYVRATKAPRPATARLLREYETQVRDINETGDIRLAQLRERFADRRERIMDDKKRAIAQARIDRANELRKERDNAFAELEIASPELAAWVLDARRWIDEAQVAVRDEYGDSPSLQMVIDNTLGLYIVRSYRIHQDPGYAKAFITEPKYARAHAQLVRYFEEQFIEREKENIRRLLGDTQFEITEDAVTRQRVESKVGRIRQILDGDPVQRKIQTIRQILSGQTVQGEEAKRLNRRLQALGRTPSQQDIEAIAREDAARGKEDRSLNRRIRDYGSILSDPDIEAIAAEDVAAEAKVAAEDWIMGHGDSDSLIPPLGVSNAIKIDFERFLAKRDLEPELLEALGEIQDPLYNFTRTMTSLTSIANNRHFMQQYLKTGLETGDLISKEQFDADPAKYKQWAPLLSKDYKNPGYAPLAGYYSSPEHKVAFDAVTKINRTVPTGTAAIFFDRINRWITGMAGSSLAIVVMGNSASSVRNIFGGGFLAARLGALFNPISKAGRRKLNTSLDMAWDAAFNRASSNEQSLAFLNRLKAGGVIANGVNTNFVREVLNQYKDDPGGFMNMLQSLLARVGDGAEGNFKKVRELGGATFNTISNFWEFTESLYNIPVFLKFYAILQEANFGTEEQMFQEAADRTRLVLPMHSEQSQAIGAFTRNPLSVFFAPFIRFKSEILRCMFNTYKLALRDIKSGNPVLAREGRKMLATASLVDIGVTAVVPQILKALAGIGDDEDEAIRSAMPDYAKNSNFIYILNRETGALTTWDLTYFTPLSLPMDPAVLLFRAAVSGRVEDVPGIAARFVAQDLIGENIVSGLVVDAMRNKDSTTSKPIYLDTDTFTDKIGKTMWHVAEGAYIPATAKVIYRTADAITRDQEADKWLFSPIGQLAHLVLPVKPRMQFVEDLAYRSFSETRAMNSQLWQITSAARSPRPMDSSEVAAMYDKKVEATVRVWRDFHAHARGFEKLGMTRSDLARTAVRAGLSRDRSGRVLRTGMTDRPSEPSEAVEKMNLVDPARARAYFEKRNSFARYLDVTGR